MIDRVLLHGLEVGSAEYRSNTDGRVRSSVLKRRWSAGLTLHFGHPQYWRWCSSQSWSLNWAASNFGRA